MCLIVNKFQGVRVLKSPKVVYKVISLGNCSEIRGFHYVPNNLYRLCGTLKIEYNVHHKKIVNKGFHAFTTFSAAQASVIHYGRHGDAKVVAFTIPAGANVVYGMWDNIVSDRIVSGDLTKIKIQPM